MKKEVTCKRNLSLFFPDLEPNIQLRGEHFFQQRNVSCQECGGKFSYSRPNWEWIMKTKLLSLGKQDQLKIWCTTLKGIKLGRIWILTHSQRNFKDLVVFSFSLLSFSLYFFLFLLSFPFSFSLSWIQCCSSICGENMVWKLADALCMF